MTDYHAKYFAYELTKRSPSDSVEKLTRSLADAQVDLNPHQVDAALFAFRSPLSKGAILADEVGLGKTIEAGIVLSQKWAERKRKLLVIVPANLRNQWNQELLDKFYLPSIILETKSFNEAISAGNLNPFDCNDIVITSYHFARAKDAYLKLVPWDLVVIDEAHRLRNVYKPTNKISNAIKAALINSPKILLTATPLQNSLLELYGLVSIIDDYTFGDLKSFKEQFGMLNGHDDLPSVPQGNSFGIKTRYKDNFDDLKERLKPVCQRTLRKQVTDYINFTNRNCITQEFIPSEDEQRLYDLVSSYLQRPNLYALPASQRKLMTLILRKLLASSTYAISGTLEALSVKLEETIKSQSQVAEEIQETVEENFEELVDYADEYEEDGTEEIEQKFSPEGLAGMREEIQALKEFASLAFSIKKNSKGEVLRTALDKGFSATESKGGKRKAIIFTESRRTQEYLRQILEATEHVPTKASYVSGSRKAVTGKIVLFNGTNNDPKSREIYDKWFERHNGTDRVSGSRTADLRSALVDYFRDEAEIMIATEAAAEGINLQFCSLVVNYDLPWNPQRIEQRIGRCHRYGQTQDVVVVNFLNRSNAADLRVYQLLSEKFNLFNGVFGASDEVLGTIESGVDFEKRIADIYLQCRTEEEIQSSFDQLQKELDAEINQEMQSARRKLLENFDEEVHEKLKLNLEESKHHLNKYETLLWQITRYFLEPFAEFDTSENSFTLLRNPFPEEQIHPGPYRIGKNIEDANTYRIGHPLAERIISRCKEKVLTPRSLTFNYSDSDKKISILEPLIGKSGWLTVVNLTVTAFESEDHLLLSGICDDVRMDPFGRTPLDSEVCRRMFSIPATVTDLSFPASPNASIGDLSGNPVKGVPPEVEEKLNASTASLQKEVLGKISERNSGFFENEMEKLEKWAEDVKTSLEIELKQLDKDIKFKKTESKKILNLEEKVAAQREIKEMEKRRNSLRQDLFKAQDEVDSRKETLIGEIEQRLKAQVDELTLFTIRWKIT
ncbi:MAG: SNF2-related protein [Bacteroidetes bacterium]|nr:SNF2-related protein [Bacteroidota bacterium]